MFETFNQIMNKVEPGGEITVPQHSTSDLLGMAVNFMIGVGFSIAIITMAYSMVMFVTSGGNPEKTTKAWNAFIWSVIAAIISIFAVSLRTWVFEMLGINVPGVSSGVPDLEL